MTLPLTAPQPSATPFRARLAAAWQRHRGWLLTDVLAPVLLTRVLLVGMALVSPALPANPLYPEPGVPERGWEFTPVRWVDVWARWDSSWYLDVIQNGYHANGDIRTLESNLGFFPLYPYLVKALAALLPPALQTTTGTLFTGLLLSNAFLLGGLALLRQWVAGLTGDPAVARRTILLLLIFPTGFFFSTFYTESTFLFFAAAALLAAQRRAWFWACLAGALLTLSRPLGLLIGVPLAWQYAEAARWNIRNLRWNAAWFGLLPLAFLAFCFWLYLHTGDFWATLHTRQAWGRGFAWPWETLLHPNQFLPQITPFEQVALLAFIALALLALRRLPSPGLGVWALLLLAPPLFTGQVTSSARYDLVVLPVFVVLAQLDQRRPLLRALLPVALVGSALYQLFLFALWCQFHWTA